LKPRCGLIHHTRLADSGATAHKGKTAGFRTIVAPAEGSDVVKGPIFGRSFPSRLARRASPA
jgi:hypothetical protein